MKNLMLTNFTKLLLGIRSKTLLSFLFCISAAVLSAFLDALTVTAVLIGVMVGFYRIYHAVISGNNFTDENHNYKDNSNINSLNTAELEEFKGFLRDLVMHGAVGTALGGVCTTVGEPQNLLIAGKAGWDFMEFFIQMAPITMPILFTGLLTCIIVEKFSIAGFGNQLPLNVREVFNDYSKYRKENITLKDKTELLIYRRNVGTLQRIELSPKGIPRRVSLDSSGRVLAVQVSRSGKWDVEVIRLKG